MFLMLLAIASAPPPAGTQKTVFSYEDYPVEAVRNGWEGKVISDLTIGTDGRPTACKIVKSSGRKVLDDATCNLLMRRARFVPARDKNGNPTTDVIRTPPVEWRIAR